MSKRMPGRMVMYGFDYLDTLAQEALDAASKDKARGRNAIRGVVALCGEALDAALKPRTRSYEGQGVEIVNKARVDLHIIENKRKDCIRYIRNLPVIVNMDDCGEIYDRCKAKVDYYDILKTWYLRASLGRRLAEIEKDMEMDRLLFGVDGVTLPDNGHADRKPAIDS